MRIPRIYVEAPLSEGAAVTLGEDAANHVVRVLRLKPGDALVVFDGHGGEYEARLARVERGHVEATVARARDEDPESPLAVALGLGISRGERMDYAIQKAVELGVAAFQPLFTARCVVRLDERRLAKRLAHWRGVVVSACEQSGRTRLPELMPAQPLTEWLGATTGTRFVLDPEAERGPRALTDPPTALTLLIGPEGGLAPDELAAAYDAGFVGLRLGPRVMRTETAGVAALAAFQTLWGDLG